MSIPAKDLIVGHRYLDNTGKAYVFIGKCNKILVYDNKNQYYEKFTGKYYVYLDTNDCNIFFTKNFPDKFPVLIKHLTRKSVRNLEYDIGIDNRFTLIEDKYIQIVSNSGYIIQFFKM